MLTKHVLSAHSCHLPDRSEREATKLDINVYERRLEELRRETEEIQALLAATKASIAPQRYLPHEILAIIFIFVYDEEYDIPRGSGLPPDGWIRRDAWWPMNLAQVSRRWRQVALTTPRIWTKLIVEARKTKSEEMMNFWFENAKSVPINLTFIQNADETGHTNWVEAAMFADDELVTALESSMHQVLSLTLAYKNSTSFDLDNLVQIMTGRINPSKLRSLRLVLLEPAGLDGVWGLPELPPQLLLQPTLSSIQINTFYVCNGPNTLLPPLVNPSNITVLKLDGHPCFSESEFQRPRIYGKRLLQLLERIPNLQRLRLAGYSATPLAAVGPMHPIELPHMRRLTLIGLESARLVEYIITPKLETLKVAGFPEDDDDWSGWGILLNLWVQRSKPPIRKLSLKDVPIDGDGVVSLKHMVSLETLVLSQPDSALELFRHILTALTAKDDQPGMMFLPMLSSLRWRSISSRPCLVDWTSLKEARGDIDIRELEPPRPSYVCS